MTRWKGMNESVTQIVASTVTVYPQRTRSHAAEPQKQRRLRSKEKLQIECRISLLSSSSEAKRLLCSGVHLPHWIKQYRCSTQTMFYGFRVQRRKTGLVLPQNGAQPELMRCCLAYHPVTVDLLGCRGFLSLTDQRFPRVSNSIFFKAAIDIRSFPHEVTVCRNLCGPL